MALEFSILEDLHEFRDYIRKFHILQVAQWINFGYYLGISITYLLLLAWDRVGSTIFTTDFQVFYSATVIARTNPGNLYAPIPGQLPFRYLPLFAYFFLWISYFPLPLAYLLHNGVMCIINYLAWFFLYELCANLYKLDMTREIPLKGLFIFILAPLHLINFMLGQINSLFILLLLGSIFFFENQKIQRVKFRWGNFWGGLMLAMAVVLKPFAVLFYPFILGISLRNQGYFTLNVRMKEIFLRLFGLIIIGGLNALIFWRYRGLLDEFYSTNFVHTLNYHHATSITRLIIDIPEIFHQNRPIWGLGQNLVMIIITFMFLTPGFLLYLLQENSTRKYTYYYSYATLVLLLAYPDSWFLYILIWYAVSLPGWAELGQMITNDPEEKPHFLSIRYWLLTKIVNYNMLYFTAGVICFYLLLGFDPFAAPSLVVGYIVFFSLHVTSLESRPQI
jgi:hypothetical protein